MSTTLDQITKLFVEKDTAGTGKISKAELGRVLSGLGLADEDLAALLKHMGWSETNNIDISYTQFLSSVLSSEPSLRAVSVGIIGLGLVGKELVSQLQGQAAELSRGGLELKV